MLRGAGEGSVVQEVQDLRCRCLQEVQYQLLAGKACFYEVQNLTP